MSDEYHGKSYRPKHGRYAGQQLLVVGDDSLLPDLDRYLIRTPDGMEFGAPGAAVRHLVDNEPA